MHGSNVELIDRDAAAAGLIVLDQRGEVFGGVLAGEFPQGGSCLLPPKCSPSGRKYLPTFNLATAKQSENMLLAGPPG